MSTVTDSYFGYFYGTVQSAQAAEGREALAFLEPQNILHSIRHGSELVKAEGTHWISPELAQRMDSALETYSHLLHSYAAAWGELAENHTATGMGKGALTGFRAAGLGAKVGSLVAPGIGTAIGAAAGTLMAMYKENARAVAMTEKLFAELQVFDERVSDHYNTVLLPLISRDIETYQANIPDGHSPLGGAREFLVGQLFVAVIAAVLGVLHWGVSALWFPEQRRTATEEVTPAVMTQEAETEAIATSSRTRVRDRPSRRGRVVQTLGVGDRHQIVVQPGEENSDWIEVQLSDEATGFVRSRDVRIETTTHDVVVSPERVEVHEEVEESVMIGERTYAQLLRSVSPMWPYVLLGLLLVAAFLSRGSTEPKEPLWRFALESILGIAVFHTVIQAVAFAVWTLWGVA